MNFFKRLVRAFEAAHDDVLNHRQVRHYEDILESKLKNDLPLWAKDFKKIEFDALSEKAPETAIFNATLHDGRQFKLAASIDTFSAIRYSTPNSLKTALRQAVIAYDQRPAIVHQALVNQIKNLPSRLP